MVLGHKKQTKPWSVVGPKRGHRNYKPNVFVCVVLFGDPRHFVLVTRVVSFGLFNDPCHFFLKARIIFVLFYDLVSIGHIIQKSSFLFVVVGDLCHLLLVC